MTLIALMKATQIAAAVSSIALARRRAEHVPAAVALVVLAAVPLARGPLRTALHAPSVEPLHRVLVYADGAAELATYATVAGLALAVAFGAKHYRRTFALAVATWAGASVALGALYPSPLVCGEGLRRIYLAADLIGLCVSAAALVGWAQRGMAAKRSPDSASRIAVTLVALDGAILLTPFSPWRGDVFGSSFGGIQLIITVFFATFTLRAIREWKASRPG